MTVSDGHDALVAALKGIDAVVSSVGNPTFADQKAWLDAAVDAGVKRFILSEFATDLDHPDSRNLEVFKEKRATREYAESLAAEGKIEWTSILTGPFLDMSEYKFPFLHLWRGSGMSWSPLHGWNLLVDIYWMIPRMQ